MSENKRDEALSQETVSSDKAQKKAKAPAKKKDKEPNRVMRWLKDMKGELKKVSWPSGKDTAKNVLVVVVCVIVVGIFIWVFDFLAKQVVQALLSLFR
ncbi:MAG: preprotein translocase subunit SecE [Oscillospiraceae bacterium]|nr:preprotein translocase subunit SecE [Oscillospiraceae bacterium]